MKALTPLSWCEYRGSLQGSEVDACAFLAARRVEGMPFCDGHATLVEKALEDNAVELVADAAVVPQKLRKGA